MVKELRGHVGPVVPDESPHFRIHAGSLEATEFLERLEHLTLKFVFQIDLAGFDADDDLLIAGLFPVESGAWFASCRCRRSWRK
jgi:hypothetical protein